ncbi:MAG: hypothetical protein ACE5J5_02390 [Candidatus Hydrothermarchaeales archaeon]
MNLLNFDARITESKERRKGIERAKQIVSEDPNLSGIVPLIIEFLDSIKSKSITQPYLSEDNVRDSSKELYDVRVKSKETEHQELPERFIDMEFSMEPKESDEPEKQEKMIPRVVGKFSWANYDKRDALEPGTDYVNTLSVQVVHPNGEYKYSLILENKECFGKGRFIPGTRIKIIKEE